MELCKLYQDIIQKKKVGWANLPIVYAHELRSTCDNALSGYRCLLRCGDENEPSDCCLFCSGSKCMKLLDSGCVGKVRRRLMHSAT